MKEASGELNSTIIVVLIVAALAAFFFSVLWPLIKSSQASSLSCQKAVCGYDCSGHKKTPSNGTVECCYKKDKSDQGTPITCPYKG